MSQHRKKIKKYFERKKGKELSIDYISNLVESLLMLNEKETLTEGSKKSKSKGRQRELRITLPMIRLSEKMWGKEGTKDRNIIEILLKKIIAKGSTLKEKIEIIDAFLTSPPATEDISEVLSHIVLLDTLTNIMIHFNASAAGFTFEGFLAALLAGQQFAPGSGIQDIIDNDKNPISLKLITESGGAVKGSFKDLCNHFIDPGGLKQDPESEHYLAKSGAEGAMRYFIVLKSFQEMEAAEALEGSEQIRFYMFDFNASNFLELMAESEKNWKLLLLPDEEELKMVPKLGRPSGYTVDDNYNPIDMEGEMAQKWVSKKAGGFSGYNKAIDNYDADYVKEILANTELRYKDESKKFTHLVHSDTGEPVVWAKFQLGPGDARRKEIGPKTEQGFKTAKESIDILKSALARGPETFWGYIGRTAGYTQGGSETQFTIPKGFYGKPFQDVAGYGYIGRINVGKTAIMELAEKYTDVLEQQIFDIYEQLEKLSNQLNAYFVGGEKAQGYYAIGTAEKLKTETEEYREKVK